MRAGKAAEQSIELQTAESRIRSLQASLSRKENAIREFKDKMDQAVRCAAGQACSSSLHVQSVSGLCESCSPLPSCQLVNSNPVALACSHATDARLILAMSFVWVAGCLCLHAASEVLMMYGLAAETPVRQEPKKKLSGSR